MSKEKAVRILKNALLLPDDFFHVLAIEEAIKELEKSKKHYPPLYSVDEEFPSNPNNLV